MESLTQQPTDLHLRQPGVDGAIGISLGTNPHAPIDLTEDTNDEHVIGSSRKRRRSEEEWQGQGASSLKKATTTPTKAQPPPSPSVTKEKKHGDSKQLPAEKRLRRFRSQPPKHYSDILFRATSQRFYVLERTRAGTDDCPEEVVELTGSTGNIYSVSIGLVPRCTCPHAEKGHQCKHIIFVMKKVLNAPDNLVYQLALLKSELIEILNAAPPIATPSSECQDKKRKSLDNDCPICFSELDTQRPESIVWCRAACGQNIHLECFQTWARTKIGSTTCPMCRSVWEADENFLKQVSKSQGSNSEGYVNVADQLGISSARDTSTYSEWFLRSYYRRR